MFSLGGRTQGSGSSRFDYYKVRDVRSSVRSNTSACMYYSNERSILSRACTIQYRSNAYNSNSLLRRFVGLKSLQLYIFLFFCIYATTVGFGPPYVDEKWLCRDKLLDIMAPAIICSILGCRKMKLLYFNARNRLISSSLLTTAIFCRVGQKLP